MKNRIFANILSILVFFCSIPFAGATDVTGNISANTTWFVANSPYVVSGGLLIEAGKTLTIQPGVVVKFESNAYIDVNGTLNAQGSSGQKIYFTDVRDDSVGGDTNVDGTATAPAAGWWGSIRVENGGSATLDYAEVRYGGGWPYYVGSIFKDGTGSLSITNSRVSDSSSYGVSIQNDSSSFDQTNNIYWAGTPGGGTWNIDIPAGLTILNGKLQAATFSTHGYINVNGTRVLTQDYAGNCVNSVTPQLDINSLLHSGSNAIYGYADGSDCSVNSIVEARVTYQITHSAAYVVSNNVIESNAADGIYLTNISGPVTISGNTIRNNNNGINITNASGAIAITGNTAENNRNEGIYLSNTGTAVTIANNIIRNNTLNGVSVNGSSPTVTNNTITGNGSFALYSDGGSAPILSGNTTSGNTLGDRGYGGTISTNTTWSVANSPYVVSGGLLIDAGKTLTIQPGVVVKFQQSSYITVNGTLNAQGTVGQKIYFTDVRDDSVGGDTNGDGAATAPAAGWWAAIRVENGGSATLDYAEVRYGGGWWWSGSIFKTGTGSFSMTNSRVSNSATYGAFIQSDTSSFSQSKAIYSSGVITPGGDTWNLDIPAGSTILNGTLQDATFYNHGYINVNGTRVLTQDYAGNCVNYVSPQTNITALLHTGSNAIYGYADGSDCNYGSYASASISYQTTHSAAYVISNNIIEDSGNGYDGIYLNQISGPVTISGNTIRNNNNGINITNASGAIAITGNTVENNRNEGIYLSNTGTAVTIANNIIRNNTLNGVSVNGSSPTVTNNTITGNGSFALYSDGGSAPILSGNTTSGNTLGDRGYGGTISTNTTWSVANSPYVVSGGLFIDAGKTLTIQPGVVVKFQLSAYITVNGTLNAQGTVGQKIYFTDVRDDSVGGDTNGDGAATAPSAGWWAAIRVENGGSATLDYAEVRYGGGWWSLGSVFKTGTGSFSMTNSRVSNSSSYGVIIQSDTSSFSQSNYMYNSVTPGGGTWNIDIPAGSTILSGILQSSNIYSHGSIDVNGTRVLTQAYEGICYNYLTPQTDITSLLHNGNNAIYGYADGSDCSISSYVDAYITYQITHSAAYVVTNNVIENNAADGIYLNQISGPLSISGNTIRSNSNGINITNASGAIAITGNTVENNRNEGIYLSNTGTAVTIANNIIRNNTLNGVSVNGSSPTVTNNTITGNGSFALYSDGGSAPILSGNTTSGNTLGDRGYGGTISTNTTWSVANSPYVVSGGLFIDAGKTLTIQPGVVVKFQLSAYITVNGTLNAQGTVGQKIYFTDVRDDSVGGDTNGDGAATAPSAGWWAAIRVENGGSATLDYAEVRYGGGWWSLGSVFKTGTGSFSMTNSRVSNSSSYGVIIQSDTSSFSQSNYMYNSVTPGGGTWNIDIPAGSTILSGILQSSNIYSHGSIDVNGTRVLTQAYEGICYNYLTPQTDITSLLHNGNNAIYGYADGSDCSISSYVDAYITYQITHSAAYVVTNNVIENNAADGIYLNQISGPLSISGNTIRSNSNGINITTANGAIAITGNTIHHNSYAGIYLSAASPAITKNIIYANTIGIYSINGSNPIIGGSVANANDIYSNSQYAVSNDDPEVTIDARYNFWGDPAGPSALIPKPINGNVDTGNYLISSIFDTTPPTGSVIINDGSVYTKSQAVNLNLQSTDTGGTGTAKMCISETASCPVENWQTYNTQKVWVFASGTNETKHIYVWYKDYANNAETTPHHTTVILDTIPPDITLNSAPAYGTESTQASFGFVSGDPTATFQCKYDTGIFTPCTSPKVYTGVTDASYYLNLDGVDDYVKLPDNTLNSSKTITFEGWFKTTTGGVIFGYQNTDYPVTPSAAVSPLYVGNDGKLYGILWPLSLLVSANTVNDGRWHHAALVGNVNTETLYVDGVLVGTNQGVEIDYLDMGKNQIGGGYVNGYGNWYPFNGAIDEVRVWNTARTQAEILAALSASLTGTETGLSGYWKFDEGKGTTSADSTVNGKTATLVNGPLWSDKHLFEVQAIDPAKNTTTAIYEWSTSPDTTINTHPVNPTNSQSASFTFGSSKRVVTYQCKLDSGVFGSCTSPKSYVGLIEGNHTFTVEAIDAMGVADPTPASYTWRVDITPPTVTSATSSTVNGQYKAGAAINVTVNFSEPVSSTGLTITLNSGGSITTGTLSSVTSFSGSYTVAAAQTSADLSISSITGSITDAATNATVNPTIPAGQNIADSKAIVIDTTAPTIAIGAPSATVTKSGPVTYTVTYADTNFSASTLVTGNITLNKTGTANGTLGVSGTGTTRTVTISSITGDGTLGISIAAGTATDVAGNSAASAGPSTTYVVDNTVPTVTSATSSTIDGQYKAGAAINVTVNFSEPVSSTGLTITLNSGGSITTGTLSSVTSFSGSYTVAAAQTSADLSISSITGSITDAATNATVNPTIPAGQNIADSKAIVIDTTAPTIAIGAPSATVTKSGPVTYTVTYADTNFSASTLVTGNITLNKTGTANGTLGVSGTGTTRTVTISSITGDGTLGISIAAGTATDVAGNSAASAGPSTTYVVDNTVPTVTSATSSTIDGQYKAGAAINVTVNFSEPVSSTGLTITLNSGGSITTGTLSSVTSFSGSYTVAAAQTSADLSISSITGSITDAATNATVNPTIPAGQNIADSKAIVIDTTAPTIAIGAPSATVTKSGPVTYTVTYADTNFSASTLVTGNITLNKTGTANGTLGVSGTGTTRTVTISSITGDGTLGISIAAGTATDVAGNSAASAGPSTTYVVDNTVPTVTSATSSTIDGQYKAGAAINVTVNFSEPVSSTGLTITLNSGGSITTGTLSSVTSFSGSYTVAAAQTSADLSISSITGSITDAATNATVNPTIPAGQNIADSKAIVIDTTAPTIAIGAPSATVTKSGPVTYTVTYADTNFSASTLVTGNITLNKTGTANGTLGVSGTGTTRTVTISSITGDGTLGISIAAGTATDVAGNSAASAGPSTTYVVDNTVPTVTSATSSTIDGQYKAGAAINVTVNFSEPVSSTGLTITLNSGGSITTGTLSSVTSFSGSYTVAAAQTSADLSISSITGSITDAATNATVNPTIPAGQNIADSKAIVIDTTAPTIAIGAPSATVTKSGPVTYTVTYADTNFSASTLVTGNITLNKTGTANGTLGVSGTGTTRTVTISSITGDGTLGISIAAGTATDVAGNSAASAGPSTTYVVDNTVPTVTSATSSTIDGQYKAGAAINVTVNFSEPVSSTGLTITLNSGGSITTGTLSSVTSFSGSYTVAAAQTSADLSISSITGSITDAATNATVNPTIPAGQNIADSKAIVIDTTAPTIAIGAPSATVTKSGPVTYTVTYADTNFSASTLVTGNITLNKTGTANGTLGVSGTGTTRTVTISSITGDGTLGISIAAGTATDVAGNSAASAGPSTTYVVDNTVPTVTSATSSTIDGQYKAGAAINVTVNFSEPVSSTGLTITLNSGGSITTGTLSSVTSFSGSYTVAAAQTSADLSISSITGSITDAATNATVNPTIPAGQNIADSKAIVIDTTAPTIAIGAPSATVTKSGPVTYTVTYADTNFSASTLVTGNITLNKTGTANGTLGVSGTGTTRTVTISSITGDGTLGISIAAGTATDVAGNSAASAGPSTTYVVDNTVPTVTSATSSTIDGQYKAGAAINVTVNFSEPVSSTGLTITLNSGGSITTGTLSSVTSFSGSYTVAAAQTSADLSISSITGSITDAATNATVNPTIPAGQNIADSKAIVIDTTAPTIAIGAPSATVTKSGPVTYTVTYADTNFSASTLVTGNITLNKTGTANGTLGVSGTGTTRTVTISSITGDGTLGISIAAGTATDVAGNSAASAGPSTTYVVDNTVPTVTSATSSTIDGQYKAGAAINVTVNFSEPVSSTGLTITLNSGGSITTGTLSSVTSFSGSYTVAAAQTSADLSISSITGSITDAATNATVNPTIPAGQNIADSKAIVIDTTAPTIAIGAPSATVTKSGPVTYTVTYADTNFSASTLVTGNITLNKTGTANGTLGVSGTGTTRTVTISSITGDGTLGISIAAGTATDVAGNSAASAGPSGTFTVSTATFPLTLSFGGTGGGSVHGDISCDSGSICNPVAFNADAVVSLTATADVNSTFTGWSGACSGVDVCNVSMLAAPRNVTAIFDKAVLIKNNESGLTYSLLQDACDAAGNGNTIMVRGDITTLLGSLLYNRPNIQINLKGGYAAGFIPGAGLSEVQKPLIIRNGSLKVNGLVVK